jgi:hypothetical protein
MARPKSFDVTKWSNGTYWVTSGKKTFSINPTQKSVLKDITKSRGSADVTDVHNSTLKGLKSRGLIENWKKGTTKLTTFGKQVVKSL